MTTKFVQRGGGEKEREREREKRNLAGVICFYNENDAKRITDMDKERIITEVKRVRERERERTVKRKEKTLRGEMRY